LLAFFEDQLADQGSSEGRILELLSGILGYARYTKQLPPACLTYLKSMMDYWNGSTGRDIVFGLLEYTPVGPFEELYQSIFQPLEGAILDGSTESQLALISFYNNLLHEWTAFLLSESQQTTTAASAISALGMHANALALTILQSSSSITTHATVLRYYETTASLVSYPTLKSVVRITIPPKNLIYTLHCTQSLSTLSRLCAILATYKRAFELAMSSKSTNLTSSEPESYPKEYVNHFNGFLMDICNCLWRSRAFNTSDVNALGCLLPQGLLPVLAKYVADLDTSLSLPSLFNLSYSPIFCLLSISYVRELEEQDEDAIETRHAGPVTQASLKQLEKEGGLKLSWPDYRLGVLRYLEVKGANGVGELMYNTMKLLMTARDNKA